MSRQRIVELQQQIQQSIEELGELLKQSRGEPVADYRFATTEGEASLSELFGGKDTLLAIHNMGQGCRYCTVWADGFNGFLPHLDLIIA
ncbi:MAG: DUF899 family protein [Gammaproteobacteria bacterium]|nr:DUF899 family protein [Gammaproteobacteria bacterium]